MEQIGGLSMSKLIFLVAGLVVPIFSEADCSWGDGASTTESLVAQACERAGGVAHGCSCDRPSASGGASSSGAPSGGSTPEQQMILNGAQILMPALQQGIHDAIYGNPQEAARRAQENAIRRAEQKRRDEEEARQAEETKKRLLGETNNSDPNSLSLMGVESPRDLQLMTGDEALSASPRPTPSDNRDPSPSSMPQSNNFKLGFEDANQCYSQNSGARCSGLAGEQWQVCLADYRSGYQVGEKQHRMLLAEAYQVGQNAGSKGELAHAASDPRALGPCRTQWIESYNNGYLKGKQTIAAH